MRVILTVCSLMHLDVMWANGMEGRHCWTRQWTLIDPRVLDVHQVVYDLKGNLLADPHGRPRVSH